MAAWRSEAPIVKKNTSHNTNAAAISINAARQ